MAESSNFVLHYGGTQMRLKDYNGLPGTIGFRTADDAWVTIAVGPGIPVMVEEIPAKPAKERRGTIL